VKQLLDNKLAKRYAGALFKIAHDAGRIEGIFKELNNFIDFCKNEICLKEFLSQTFVDKKERREVINLLSKELSLSREFVSFMHLLIENERTRYLPKILQEFSRLRDDFLGIIIVNVISAKKLKDEEALQIKNMFEKALSKRIVINEKVSPEIIGGYIINVEGKSYDGSIKTQLENFYNYLKQGAYVYGG
jgi:F-type H+-transporting ATPase subunit delta